MTKAVATTPTLPGLLPDAEVAALADSFRPTSDFRNAEILRWPTAPERDRMQRRGQQLAALLRPVAATSEEMKVASQALGDLFLGYTATRNDPNAPKIVAAYLTHLQDVPLFAIRSACDDVKANRVYDLDRRSGNRIPLSKDHPPSSIRIQSVAMGHVCRVQEEKSKLDRVLAAKRIAPPPVSDEERARVSEGFRALANRLRGSAPANDPKLREAALKISRDASERLVRREYEALDLPPVESAGIRISPGLARKAAATKARMASEPAPRRTEGT